MAEENTQAWLMIVGLGNPGNKYARNRHNVGFHCLDCLAQKYQLTFGKKQDKARLAFGSVAGRRAILVKPQTFVNVSGEAVGAVARFYRVEPSDILVIYDELDLPQGTIRLRPSGSSGGHNGLKSIIEHLGTQVFPRMRIGIGRPPGQMDPAAYVLQNFSSEEQERMEEVYERAVEAVETLVRDGIREAMNRFNARPQASEPSE